MGSAHGTAVALLMSLTAPGCAPPDASERAATHAIVPPLSASLTILPRSAAVAMFPCSRCHAERAPNLKERRLEQIHTRIQLDHGSSAGWCQRCHGSDNADELVMLDGSRIAFDDSYKLCGSCHAEKLQDWKLNIHGLTTGGWNRARQRVNCTGCHNPHKPLESPNGWAFPQMRALAPPAQPRSHTRPLP